jgi:hypothetical protein
VQTKKCNDVCAFLYYKPVRGSLPEYNVILLDGSTFTEIARYSPRVFKFSNEFKKGDNEQASKNLAEIGMGKVSLIKTSDLIISQEYIVVLEFLGCTSY